jgi:hypothetical protein
VRDRAPWRRAAPPTCPETARWRERGGGRQCKRTARRRSLRRTTQQRREQDGSAMRARRTGEIVAGTVSHGDRGRGYGAGRPRRCARCYRQKGVIGCAGRAGKMHDGGMAQLCCCPCHKSSREPHYVVSSTPCFHQTTVRE